MKKPLKVDPVFIKAVETHFNTKVLSCSKLGNGATGNVYCCVFENEPYKAALKISSDHELMLREAEQLKLLLEKAKGRFFPQVYFTLPRPGCESALCMQMFDGVSADSIKSPLKILMKGKAFTQGASNALIELHKATNDKFGPVDNAVYDTWNDYYKTFAQSVLSFAMTKTREGELSPKVSGAMETAFSHFEEIFDEPVEKPALLHGDFWPPNIIVDPKTLEFLGAIDPFNVMWADPEYDLFGMIFGSGKRYKFMKTYKSKMKCSKRLDVKLEFYALFNEIYWCSKIGLINMGYLKYKAKRLNAEMKKAKII